MCFDVSIPIRLICSTDGSLCLRSATTSFWHVRCRWGPSTPTDEMAFGQLRAPISLVKSSPYTESGSRVLTDLTGERRNRQFRQRFCGFRSCRLNPSVGVDGPQRHRTCQNEVVADLRQREPSVEQISRIGMDTSKHIFQLHGVN